MQEQRTENYPNWATDLRNINFAEYAGICGAVGIKVEEPDDLRSAIRKALDVKGPALVDIITDPKRF